MQEFFSLVFLSLQKSRLCTHLSSHIFMIFTILNTLKSKRLLISVRENKVNKTTRWITNIEICQAVPLNYKFSPQSLVREHILLSPGVHCLFSVSSTSDSAVLGNAISPGHFFKRFYHETEVSVVFLRSWEEDTRSHIDRKNKSGRSCLQPPPSRFSKH